MAMSDFNLTIYAAVVASGALGWKIYDIWRDRSHIKVGITFAIPIYGGRLSTKQCISLTAMNKGRRPVTISGAGLNLSNGMHFAYIPYPNEFPRRLNEGESHDVFFEEDVLRQDLKEQGPNVVIRCAYFRDQTDRYYKQKLPKKVARVLHG